MAENFEFDVAIIGAGAAGLTAAIYCQRSGLKAVCIEKNTVGGHASLIEKIENYPGVMGISGMELMKNFESQAKSFGLKIIFGEVLSVSVDGKKKIVKTAKNSIAVKAVIVATGSVHKEIGLPNEKVLIGKGIHFCALCDGPLYGGKKVAVVGGGNSAVEEAIFLSRIASRVFVIHRRSWLKADKILQDRAFAIKNIEWFFDSEVKEIFGKQKLEKIVFENTKNGKRTILPVDALFEYIGRQPNTVFLEVKKNLAGMIIVNSALQSSVPGIFAAGDCIEKKVWQLATCVGEGAVAAVSAHDYIESLKD